MTTPISESAPRAEQPKAESFVDWFHINSRIIGIGAVVVLIVLFGVWFQQRTSLNETINADKQLLTAKQSLNSGNQPLAEADLKKVVDKYGDKPAGTEAGLLLAQIQIDKGDYPAAIAGLKALSAKVSSGPNATQVRTLLGDALAQSGKPADAAVEYEAAAGLTTMPNERLFVQSRAARAYIAAGKTAEAKKLLDALATQSDNEAIASEARVRLGELAGGAKL